MSTVESPLNGYIICRAPKGTIRATYFPRNNGAAIDAMMGIGSAHWPDLLEAKAFNEEYPLYISAPPGTSSAYPSHLGGFYLTKRGLHKFYNVNDKQDIADNIGNAYKVKVVPGEEDAFDGYFAEKLTTIVFSAPEIPANPSPDDASQDLGWTLESDEGHVFTFKNSGELNEPAAETKIVFTKNNRLKVTEVNYDVILEGNVGVTKSIYWDVDVKEDGWSFTNQTATFKMTGEVGEYTALEKYLGAEIYNAFMDETTKIISEENMKSFMDLLVYGYTELIPEDEEEGDFFEIQSIQKTYAFLVSLAGEVYAYFMQKSPTEKVTNIKISDIGYDKYRYDRLLPYIDIVTKDINDTDKATLAEKVATHQYVAVINSAGVDSIWGLNSDDEVDNITGNFITQYFSLNTYIGTNEDLIKSDFTNHLFYVESASKVNELKTEEYYINLWGAQDGADLYEKGLVSGTSAPKNNSFNSITISCSEVVYAGKTTSGGEFTGSLDETGRDSFGSKIYFPEILQDDDMSFLEVRVVKKFGDDTDDLDEFGFWQHDRAIDKFANITERNFTIEGDRYCTFVNLKNQLDQKTGGVWNTGYKNIISDGITEATLPDYDDVYVFMEPTGQEDFKTELANVNRLNDLATVISPKILSPNTKGVVTDQIAQRVVVNGRMSMASNAQYAGEFEVFDSVTLKKYWCQPIGDIGCNLMRIIERKYGGWAPAWTNISGDLGGQLKRTVTRAKYSFEDEATKTLDGKGINPIVFTSDEGLMILSQKTTQDPNNLSDWSFLGHTMSFLLVKREIRDSVMRPQIMKPINDYWMALRQTQVDNILSHRTGGSSPIWAMATCDIAGQNTSITKAQRNFVIKVDLKVNVFSETVTLILENHAQ